MRDTADDTAAEAGPTRRRLVTHPAVASILGAAGFSAVSTGILNVANDLVAILALGAGSLQVGVLNSLESLSFLLLSVPVGWWLDRVDRRGTLLWTQAITTLALLSIPVAWMLGVLTFWQLGVTSFLVGTSGMIWGLGLSTLIPAAAGKERAAATFARLQAVETSAALAAPGVTGALLMVMAAPLSLFFAALAELVAGIVLVLGGRAERAARPAPPGPTAGGDRAASGTEDPGRFPFWAGVAEGFRFSVSSKPIILSTLVSAVGNAALALMAAVETVYLVRHLGFSPALVGLQGTVIAAAGLAGSLLAAWLLERFGGLSVSALVGVIGTGSAFLLPLTALHPHSLGFTLPLVIAFNVLWNVSAVAGSAGKFGLLAAVVPDRIMGRVQSFRRLVSMGPVPIMGIAGGWFGEAWGLLPALWVFVALATTSAGLSLWLWIASRAWELPLPPRARRA